LGDLTASQCGDDAAKWAEMFLQVREKHGFPIDKATMIGWFANAIELSCDIRAKRMTLERSLNLAAQVWCEPKNSKTPMDFDLAVSFAAVLRKEVNG